MEVWESRVEGWRSGEWGRLGFVADGAVFAAVFPWRRVTDSLECPCHVALVVEARFVGDIRNKHFSSF